MCDCVDTCVHKSPEKNWILRRTQDTASTHTGPETPKKGSLWGTIHRGPDSNVTCNGRVRVSCSLLHEGRRWIPEQDMKLGNVVFLEGRKTEVYRERLRGERSSLSEEPTSRQERARVGCPHAGIICEEYNFCFSFKFCKLSHLMY